MNPALSVIIFTVLAGLGQGLAVCVAVAVLAGLLPGDHPLLPRTLLASIVLLVLGLTASFFHLARPLRAWRAVAMWRTSWLSREVIVLPATLGILVLWWWGAHSGRAGAVEMQLAAVATVAACLLLWVCTAMIYASIRIVAEWASPMTLVSYILTGLASGTLLFTAISAIQATSALTTVTGAAALVLTLGAGAIRLAMFRRNAHLHPRSTVQSATGIGNARVIQKTMGVNGSSFNTREFFHKLGSRGFRSVSWCAALLGLALPVALSVWGMAGSSPWPWVLAPCVQVLGLLGDRWLFFAQVNHPQNIYYQRVA